MSAAAIRVRHPPGIRPWSWQACAAPLAIVSNSLGASASPPRHRAPETELGSEMRKANMLGMAIALASLPSIAAASTISVMTRLPDDPKIVVVKGIGDGRADDTAAIQSAIDQAHAKTGE